MVWQSGVLASLPVKSISKNAKEQKERNVLSSTESTTLFL
jgi:hypothetical protein